MTSNHYLFFVTLLSLVILDVVTTSYGLEFNIITEGNPFVAGIVGVPLLHLAVKIAFVALVASLAVISVRLYKDDRALKMIYVPNIGVYLFVLGNNLYWLFLV